MSDTGFFMKDAIENLSGNFDKRRLICVISSDPRKGKYYIPRQGVQYLFLCEHRLGVKPHSLSFAQKLDPQKWTVVAEKGKQRPVFSTADTVYGYKIVCDGTDFWMYKALGIPRRPGGTIAELKVFDSVDLTTQRQ
ncbi:MAG: hypothetical protein LBD60_02100 [Puniceicoccales bacterium]|nr:hypothetical protein [Puniceicoccales bacterium]